jgi:hypothetical protein
MVDQISSSESPTGHKNANILNNSNNKNNYRKNKPMNTNKISTSHNPTNGLYELNITGQIFTSTVKDEFLVPFSVIAYFNSNEFPLGITIIPDPDNVKFKGFDHVISPRIKNLNGKKVSVEFNYCPKAEEVAHYKIGYPLYQELLIDHLLLNKNVKPKILVNEFTVDTFHFNCSIELPAGPIHEIFFSTLGYYQTSRCTVLEAGNKISQFLRKQLKLPVKPNKLAKVKY